MTLTTGSLFSGIGGFEIAFEAAGFRTAWQVERDPFCLQVLARHFPHAERYTDIHDCHDLPYVDVMTAGFPCQPFSDAGKKRGKDDERYLVPEMLRVIREVKPRVVLLENVPGFASLNDGAEFRQLLRALAEIGFDAEWGHLRASDVGAPHRRERWFCVAYRPNAWVNRGERFTRHDAKSGGKWSAARRNRGNGGVFTMANASGIRRGQRRSHRQERHLLHEQGRRGAENQWTRHGWERGVSAVGEVGDMADAHRRRQQAGYPAQRQLSIAHSNSSNRRYDAQPQLCRDVDGLPAGLDSHQWPARPGEAQYPCEPPRTIGKGETTDRTQRLKALGNAVVPQVVYPLAIAIREFLQSESAVTG